MMCKARRARSLALLSAVPLAMTLAGCGSSSGTTRASAHNEGPPSGVSNDNAPSTAAATVQSSGGQDSSGRPTARSQLLVTGPGFSPSPIRATGLAGGNLDGESSGSGCTGLFPAAPQHILKVSRRVPTLRVMVDGVDRDLTLALHLPDGRWECNDDSGDPAFGLNPAVDFASGLDAVEVEVFVGTFGQLGSQPPYTIGVTEDLSAVPSSMRPGGSPGMPDPGMPPPAMPSPALPF